MNIRVQKLCFLGSIILLLCSFSFAQSTTSTSSTSLCASLNSLDVYAPENLAQIQNYLKTYFPALAITAANDAQTKYFISKFQYSFGLPTTGILNASTIRLLTSQNKCFDLETTVNKIIDNKIKFKPSTSTIQSGILNGLLQKYFSTFFAKEKVEPNFSIQLSTSTQQIVDWQKANPSRSF